MGNETNSDQDIDFNWKAYMRFLLETAGEREKIGPAWFLFFDIAYRADRGGLYTQTYAKLAKRYGVAIVTVKKWRKYLYQNSIIETFNHGHAVAFRLLEPYRSFIKTNSSKEIKSEENEELKDLFALKQLLLKTVKGGKEGVSN
ncbi:MAG: hypothetical protein HYZ83_02230 [Candidatus Omnitrophica bacterium]|nr:hypothetical protein [Candidatus Omnitrophota bacterium]